jgi:mannose-6-phosphate isomerase
MEIQPFYLIPQYRDYVWGGDRLRPGQAPTAEAWVVYEDDLVADGPLAGKTLGEAAAGLGEDLLGAVPLASTGRRFPLLIKLLDCAAWLSLQVHPNDEQARALEGPGHFGKTEAWYVIEAAPEAEILCGLKEPVTLPVLAQAVRNGEILELARRIALKPGDSIFIPPGMLHALGPGLLVYEVQQTSNLTYRVFDWNRPASEGRKLHIDQSLAVLNPAAGGQAQPWPGPKAGQAQRLVDCAYFTLELLAGAEQPFALDTRRRSFHTLTVIEGQARAQGDGWRYDLERFQTLLVPAACGAYTVEGRGGEVQVLKSSVEEQPG